MASNHQKRKADSIQRRAQLGGRPKPVKDGDRRRRPTTDLVRDAIARKQITQSWNLDAGPEAVAEEEILDEYADLQEEEDLVDD